VNIKKYINEIKEDEDRNNKFLHLTANENQLSETARTFLGSKISERYYFGGGNEMGIADFGHFTGLGLKSIEDLILAAEDAAKDMLHALSVNLNLLSGVHAMMSSILATTEPGDIVMTVPLEFGGHFATVGILERIGRKHEFLDFDIDNLKFDSAKIGKKYKEIGAKALYLDVSYYLNPHNLREIREAVGSEAIIIYDASHTIGLIMGQQFQSPLEEGADVISANTHKTLPGPHKGMIAFKNIELADKANSIINSCLYSTPHTTHLIALSITLLEMKEFGVEFAKQTITNSNAIAKAFENLGYVARKSNSGKYSENHQAHIFIDDKGGHLKLYKNLIDNGISTNFEGEELAQHKWFIRIGTSEITRRGMKEGEMVQIAGFVDKAIRGEDVKKEVFEFNKRFTKIMYSFDN
jgi:glycine hydroxymethyltransferase